MDAYEITLPHGFAARTGWCQRLALRKLTGTDQRFIAEMPCGPRGVTALIGRLISAMEDGDVVARELTLGDREAVLLHLCAELWGKQLDGVVDCPACAAPMNITLRVDDLLLSATAQATESYDVWIGTTRVRLRPLRGADVEWLETQLHGHALEDATDALLQRCVLSATPPLPATSLPTETRARLSEALAQIDPQAEILLDLICPACAAAFQAPFDTATYLLRELRQRQRFLDHEVHALAWHYHWSERDILALPLRRRQRYLEMVAGNSRRAGAGV